MSDLLCRQIYETARICQTGGAARDHKAGAVGRAAVARTGGVRRDGIGDGGGTEGGEARERSPPCDVKARVE